jgi:hypothetical protein
MNDEVERVCKESVVAYFEAISQHLLQNTEEIHQHFVLGYAAF